MEGGKWKREEEEAGPSSVLSSASGIEKTEDEEEDEKEDTNDHKNSTFVPGPLLSLKDQIDRDKVFLFFSPI